MKKCDVVVLEKCFIYYEKTEDELKAERDEDADRGQQLNSAGEPRLQSRLHLGRRPCLDLRDEDTKRFLAGFYEEAERTRGRHRHVGTQHWNDRPFREAHHV